MHLCFIELAVDDDRLRGTQELDVQRELREARDLRIAEMARVDLRCGNNRTRALFGDTVD